MRFAKKQNYNIPPPIRPSYKAKGIVRHRKPDIILDLDKRNVTQPTDNMWDDSSDNLPIIYKVNDINIKLGKGEFLNPC